MSKEKFTQGEWRCVPHWHTLDVRSYDNPGGNDAPATGEHEVCNNKGDAVASGIADIRSAHLISAAPDVYRALELLCSEVNQLDLCEAPEYALKALAKARGEE